MPVSLADKILFINDTTGRIPAGGGGGDDVYWPCLWLPPGELLPPRGSPGDSEDICQCHPGYWCAAEMQWSCCNDTNYRAPGCTALVLETSDSEINVDDQQHPRPVTDPPPTNQQEHQPTDESIGPDRSATFKFYDSMDSNLTTQVGILGFEGTIRHLEAQLQGQSKERVFVVYGKAGNSQVESDLDSNFFESQVGTLCAVHASHNAVGSDSDPTLSMESFRIASEYWGNPRDGNFGDDEITMCFEASESYDILCCGQSTFSLMRMVRKAGPNLCGFVVHKPGHWVALRRCGAEDAEFKPVTLPSPQLCGVADCKCTMACRSSACRTGPHCDCVSEFRCRKHKHHNCDCAQPKVKDFFRKWLKTSNKASAAQSKATMAKADAETAAQEASAKQAEETKARAALKRQLKSKPTQTKKLKLGRRVSTDRASEGAGIKRMADVTNLPDVEVEYEVDKKLRTSSLPDFVRTNLPKRAKCEQDRKVHVLADPPIGKRHSTKKQGTRCADVAKTLLSRRPDEFPGQTLAVRAGQLFCEACHCNVGSAKSAVAGHVLTVKHAQNVITALSNSAAGQQLLGNIQDFEIETEKTIGKRIVGSVHIADETKLFRAETLRETILAGVSVEKLNKLRGFLERRTGLTLVDASKLMAAFLPPIRTTELKTLMAEVEGHDIGVYWDETTFSGTCMCICIRFVTEELVFAIRCINLVFLEAAVDNLKISSMLIQSLATILGISLERVLAFMYDSASPNIKSNGDTMSSVCPFSDPEPCCPHTGSHVGEHFETPIYDEFLKEFNAALATPGRARTLFISITSCRLYHGASGRWWFDNDIAERSLFPSMSDGSLKRWVVALGENGLCDKTAPRMLGFFTNDTKRTLLWLELAVLALCGKPLKAGWTTLEGDRFEYLRASKTMAKIRAALQSPVTLELKQVVKQIAAAAPRPPTSTTAKKPATKKKQEDSRLAALLSLKTVVGVCVSILAAYWSWGPEGAPQLRYRGEITRWASKDGCKLYIRWEDRAEGGAESLCDQHDDTNFLLEEGFDFRLEPYGDGRPTPTPPLLSTPFLLAQTDLRDENVLLARVDAIVAPAHAYFCSRFSENGDRASQMARMNAAVIFDPLHVKSAPITAAQIDALEVFRFSQDVEKATHLVKMKDEVKTYNALAQKILPLSLRLLDKDDNKTDTFDLQLWWLEARTDLPSTFQIMRAVLTHAPNSIPPERCFSILADSFDEDQECAYADYMETSVQLQFNNRGR